MPSRLKPIAVASLSQTNKTMPVVYLSSGDLAAQILPDAGASIISLSLNRGAQLVPLMRPTPAEAVQSHNVGQMASFTLVPWSNRIVNAAFDFLGTHSQLRPNTPQGFAIHGDARERSWHVTLQASDALTCVLDSREFSDFNFPFPFVAELNYRVTATAFETSMSLFNVGSSPLPAGFGFHPYFNRGITTGIPDEAQLQLNVSGVYQPLAGMHAQQLAESVQHQPAGALSQMVDVPPAMDFSALQTIGPRDIDHCFGGWNGQARIVYPSTGLSLDFECDAAFGHVIIYTPPGKPFFAVEPVTHANDGINLLAQGVPGSGVQILPPGQKFTGMFRIKVTI